MGYDSVFISYGHPDEDIAKRLHAKLTTAGVIAFLFARDAPVGQPLHTVMRAGINECDRVILLCSEASLQRSGVLNEIEELLRREAREAGRSILIPVALDDFVLTRWKPSDPTVGRSIRDRVILFTASSRIFTKADFERLLAALRRPGPGELGDLLSQGGFQFYSLKANLGGDRVRNSLTLELLREKPVPPKERMRLHGQVRTLRGDMGAPLLGLIAGLIGAAADEFSYAAVAEDQWYWTVKAPITKLEWALFDVSIRRGSRLPARVKSIDIDFHQWHHIMLSFWTDSATVRGKALERLWSESESTLRPLCEAAWAYVHGRLQARIGKAKYWWQDSVEADQARTARDAVLLIPALTE
jgi:hypothetical protein